VAPNKKLAASSPGNRDIVTILDVRTWTKMATIDCGPEYPGRPQPFYLIGNQLPCLTKFNVPHDGNRPHRASCQVWDVRTCQRIHEFQGHAQRISSIQFSPMDLFWRRHLVTTPYVYGICMFASHCTGTPSPAMLCRNVEPSLQHIVGAGGVRSMESNELLWTRPSEFPDKIIRCMVMSPDDKFLATSQSDKATWPPLVIHLVDIF